MKITRVDFQVEVRGETTYFSLHLMRGRWTLFKGSSDRVVVKSFTISSDNYRIIAVKVYEAVHGEVGTFGDLSPYVAMVNLIAKE